MPIPGGLCTSIFANDPLKQGQSTVFAPLQIDCWDATDPHILPKVYLTDEQQEDPSDSSTGHVYHTGAGSKHGGLSVLKSHFNPACIGDCKQLLSKSEKRFVHTLWVQEGLGLSEVLCVTTVLFVGKCGVRFRRFKKGSRALATRAKTHCLDQNRQSLGYIAHRSNH